MPRAIRYGRDCKTSRLIDATSRCSCEPSLLSSVYSSYVEPALGDTFHPLIPAGFWLCCFTCLECPSRSCPPSRLFPLQETVETSQLGSLVRITVPCCASLGPIPRLIAGIYCTVGFMCVSLHLTPDSQRAKICSCSSLYSALYRQSNEPSIMVTVLN